MAPGVRAADTYGAFAWAYDHALGERFAAAAGPLVDSILQRFPVAGKTHLDVACGTGILLDYFIARGFTSIGVDISPPMLDVARRRGGRLVLSDYRDLPFRSSFALVTCFYDSLNHLLERKDLVAAFRSVGSVMDGNSRFIFDINHPTAYPRVWGAPDPFEASGSHYELVMATSYSSYRKRGRALVTGWADVDGTRLKIEEEHHQRAWTQKEVLRSLDEAGLTTMAVVGFDPFDDGFEPPTKLLFVCRKV
jgi:SAM-dependent methyltransferase